VPACWPPAIRPRTTGARSPGAQNDRIGDVGTAVKHAGPVTLAALATLLSDIRKRPLLREKSPGSFYVRSKGYLHFHEDPAGIFADVKLDFEHYTRMRVSTAKEQRALLARIDRSLAGLESARERR